MATGGFLDVLRRERPDALPPPTRLGATSPPGHAPGTFLFATGVECSYPMIDGGRTRRDLLAECGHYDH